MKHQTSKIRILQLVSDPRIMFKVYTLEQHWILLPDGVTLLIDYTKGLQARVDYKLLECLSPLEVMQELKLSEEQKEKIMKIQRRIVDNGIYSIEECEIIL